MPSNRSAQSARLLSMNHVCPCPTFGLEYAQISDLGMRRMNNQDSVAVIVTDDENTWASRGHLLMVADGMGAHAAGELASKLAVDNVPHVYFKLRDLYPPAALRQAIREANALIHTKGQSSIGFQGMGTTCSCLVLIPEGALVAHIGDSRVYRLRGNRLAQLTFDHSLVWEMAAAGHMSEEDVPAYIPKNVITRSLGPHESVNLDLEGPYDAAEGDVFLLCSDGLSGQIPDAELGAILRCLNPTEAVQTLVDLANLRGGPDNISIVVARVVGDGSSRADQTTRVGHSRRLGARRDIWLGGAAVACLFAAAFCLVNQLWAALTVFTAGLVTSVGYLAYSKNGASDNCGSSHRSIGGPYGNGPYRETPCEPNRKVVDSLAEIAATLRQLPEGNSLNVDWPTLDRLTAEAKAAADVGDYMSAIKRYSEGIRSTMQNIRQQRETADVE
jgi:PPM family protein phosphatase